MAGVALSALAKMMFEHQNLTQHQDVTLHPPAKLRVPVNKTG
jgi:hypothetical protein